MEHVGPCEEKNGRQNLNKGDGWEIRVDVYGTTVVWFLDLEQDADAVLFRLTFSA